MRPIPTTTTATASSLAPTSTAPPSTSTAQGSSWHSPVPYLFGGLAAMLGLIAFALLILACSYWKLSGHQLHDDEESGNNNNNNRNMERKEEGDSANNESVKVYEEKILVIMAGDEKPTFLATPACAKCSSSFTDDGVGNNHSQNKYILNRETLEKSEKETDSHVQATTLTPQTQQQETTQQQSQLQ